MAVRGITLTAPRVRARRRGHMARAWSRLIRKKIAVACISTLVVLYLAALSASWIAPYEYTDQDLTATRKPPSFVTDHGINGFWTQSHFFGTDRAGRDVFTRVLWAVQNTIILTLVGMLTGSLVLGVTLGLVSGYFGKGIDSLIQRTGELFTVLPTFFLIIIIAVTVKPRVLEWVRWLEDNSALDGLVRSGLVDYIVVSLALVSFGWFSTARLVRGQILYLKETQAVEAARAIGASTPRILFRHLLPNAISPIVVTVTMGMGSMVGAEIFLSWIGLGIQPPRPSLGVMLFEGGGHLSIIRTTPWMLLAPGLAAFVMVLAWNLLGDALNDVLNPRTR